MPCYSVMTSHMYHKIGSHMWLQVQDQQSSVDTGAENDEPNVTLKQTSVRYPPSPLNWLCPYRPSKTSLHDILHPTGAVWGPVALCETYMSNLTGQQI